jgi:hypothetical protein
MKRKNSKPPEALWKCRVGGRRWKTLVSRYGSPKLDIAFPTAAPPPLEIAKGAISTFPQRRRRFSSSQSQTQKQAPPPSAVPAEGFTKGDFCRFSPSRFRIILCWNQNAVSVSSFDWKMLGRPARNLNRHSV